MGIIDWFRGPEKNKGDYQPQGDLAKVDPRALTPDDRSTPGLYTSSDVVRKFEALVFSNSPGTLTKDDVQELQTLVNNSEELVELTTDYKNLAQQLAKNETRITSNLAQLKPYVARQHAYQNKEHNKMLAAQDYNAIQYQKNRTGRLKGTARLRQIMGQMKQQQRQFRR